MTTSQDQPTDPSESEVAGVHVEEAIRLFADEWMVRPYDKLVGYVFVDSSCLMAAGLSGDSHLERSLWQNMAPEAIGIWGMFRSEVRDNDNPEADPEEGLVIDLVFREVVQSFHPTATKVRFFYFRGEWASEDMTEVEGFPSWMD